MHEKSPQFEAWHSFSYGGIPTEELLKKLEKQPYILNHWAKLLLAGFVMPQEKRTISIGRTTLKKLGFTEKPTLEEIHARIYEDGGENIPVEAIAQLRLAIKSKEKVHIVSEPATAEYSQDPRIDLMKKMSGAFVRDDQGELRQVQQGEIPSSFNQDEEKSFTGYFSLDSELTAENKKHTLGLSALSSGTYRYPLETTVAFKIKGQSR